MQISVGLIVTVPKLTVIKLPFYHQNLKDLVSGGELNWCHADDLTL